LKRFTRIALVALTATFLSAPLVAADLPLEFKGIRIGTRVTDADPLVMGRPDARVSCGSLREGGATICTDGGGWMIGDVAIGVVIIIEDYRIEALGITFNPDAWDTVLRAFTGKYGPPSKSGAETFQWQHRDGVIIATHHDKGSDDKSLVLLAGNAFLHRVNKTAPAASGR
jgi:hypothetical protein